MTARTTPQKRTASQAKRHVITDHARVDPTHCLADGLFRPLFRGKADNPLAIHYRFKDYVFYWQAPSPLGINEQSVFLAVLRLAAIKHRQKNVDDKNDAPKLLEARQALGLELSAAQSPCIIIETTLNELTRTIGREVNGQSGKRIFDSLQRLAQVKFHIENAAQQNIFQCNLLSVIVKEKNLLIGISPKLCQSLTMKSPASYIDMREQRAIESDITKRLHVWLSCWAGIAGKRGAVSLDNLIPHVWGNTATGDALYSRRQKLRDAITELSKFAGWSVTLTDNGQLHVSINPVDAGASIFSDVTSEKP